jgi:GT2 family glycosyltransferase
MPRRVASARPATSANEAGDDTMLIRVSETVTGPPRGAWLSGDVALLIWNSALWAGPFRPSLDGRGIAPPLLAAALPDSELRAGLIRLSRAHRQGAVISLGAGAPPLPLDDFARDAADLADGLTDAARHRLLRLLLDAGTGLFNLQACPGYLALAGALAHGGATAVEAARPVATGPEQLRLVRTAGPAPAGPVFLVGPTRVQRLAAIGGAAVHMLIEAPAPGEILCGGAEVPWMRRIVAPEGNMPPLLDLLATGRAESRAIAALLPASLGHRAGEPAIAGLLEAASLLAPARPRTRADLGRAVAGALELALPDRAGGLFLRGWLRDPHGLIVGLALATPSGPRPLPAGSVHRFRRRDLAERFRNAAHAPGEEGEGFVAHLADAAGVGPQPDLMVQLRGGAAITLTPALRTLPAAAARNAVLGSVRPEALTEAMLQHCIGPAASRLHAAHRAAPRTPLVRRLGDQPRSPEVSVIVPLYRNLGFMRAQVAAFAADPDWRDAETIFVLDSPEQAAEVEHLLRGLHLMHGLPVVLAVPPRNLGYAGANNLAASLARGRMLLLLNSDVVPDRPGWLSLLARAAAARGVGAAGPKLLFDDGSIQHAGLYFARDPDGIWYNRHYHKGFPRSYGPACRAREVPAVTGAALMVKRALFEAVGGLSEDYVVGDYEDSDLCLKLRASGARIRYEPDAELWHFERRSIGFHQGYAGTLASHFNRRLHAERWGSAMDALMRRLGAEGGPA